MPRFEEVIELVDRRAVLNIHIKDEGPGGRVVRLVCDLVRQYGLTRMVYIAGDSEAVLQTSMDYDPDIERACLIGQDSPSLQIERAQEFDCSRIQFGRAVKKEDIHRAHDAGFVCNMYYSDEPADAIEYLQKGIDVILTNRPHVIFAAGLCTPLNTFAPLNTNTKQHG
jgi:glycerophosphoryl diester phosphodiesterase